MKLTPAASERSTSAVAPAWSTVPIAFQKPSPPAKVMVPRQISDTSRPVRPRGRYFMRKLLMDSEPRTGSPSALRHRYIRIYTSGSGSGAIMARFGHGSTPRRRIESIMLIIRHLQYLTALARERHFARRRRPATSPSRRCRPAIKQLEESLGVLIAERGQRFVGLTPEGERVLDDWRSACWPAMRALNQELGEMRAGLVGHLRLGAIPVTLPTVALLTTPFALAHRSTNLVVTLADLDRDPARARRFHARCGPDLSRQRAARPRAHPAALSRALRAADAERRAARAPAGRRVGPRPPPCRSAS